jgi:hypothetical protein
MFHKILFLSLVVSCLQFGCTDRSMISNDPQATSPKPEAEKRSEGGVNGGGGGTLPANPISVKDVVKIVNGAKTELQLIVTYHGSLSRPAMQSPLEKMLYGGRVTIFDKINTTDIEVLTDRACKDTSNRDVDGSAFASKANSICISAYRIAPKLIAERAKTEILALMLHEFSHLLGANEVQAQDYQQEMALFLSWVTISPSKFIDDLFIKLGSARDALRDTLFAARTMSEVDLLTSLSRTSGKLTLIKYEFDEEFFSAFDPVQSAYFDLQRDRLEAAVTYQTSKVIELGRDLNQKYESIFQGSDEITYETYLQRTGQSSARIRSFLSAKFAKIKSRDDLEKVLESLDKYLEQAGSFLWQMKNGTRPNRLTPNKIGAAAWEKFIGEYEVVSAKCDPLSASLGLRKLVISSAPSDENQLHLYELHAAGGGDLGGLYDGARAVMISASVFVEGGSDWAERTYELGDRWYANSLKSWNQVTERISKTKMGVQFTKTRHFRNFASPIPKEEISTCEYELKLK